MKKENEKVVEPGGAKCVLVKAEVLLLCYTTN